MRVLIVEDSPALAQALLRGLGGDGYACDHAADGGRALGFLAAVRYDLVILDLMLPDIDGLDVLRELRLRDDAARVLVLSARDQVGDRVTALDAGADDYLVKPFAFDELLARLRALKRRPLERCEPVLRHAGLELDPRSRSVRRDGLALDLTPKEFGLLELLLHERGRVLSRTQIFERLYHGASETSDKAVEVILSTLRAKLARCNAGELIQTRRGFGYVIE